MAKQPGGSGGSKRPETTSPRVAREASKVLRSPTSTASQKAVAGSALTQARDKPKK